MDAPTSVIDSPAGWVKKQIDEYLATDGAKPVFRYGAPLVLVTYLGRRTGEWHRTCLIGAEFDGSWLLVASKGGADDDPVWYSSLVETKTAWLHVGADYFPVTARTAGPDEKPAMWDYMVSLYPDYADYQLKTSREIPVVILTPIPVGA